MSWDTKVTTIKEEIDKLGSIMITNMCFAEGTVKKMQS